jgi:hypothetical protein
MRHWIFSRRLKSTHKEKPGEGLRSNKADKRRARKQGR